MTWFRGRPGKPCRMNLADVKIRPLRRDGATSEEPIDRRFQEPTGDYVREDDELILEAQVKFTNYERNSPFFSGDAKPVAGRLTFETEYLVAKLAAAGLEELRNGDMITSIGGKTTDYLIVEGRPRGWLTGPGTRSAHPTITTVWFIENQEEHAALRGPRG